MGHITKITFYGIIILLFFIGCETLEIFDIRGDWDTIVYDSINNLSETAISTFQGTMESGTVTNNLPPGDIYYQDYPSTYVVRGNHVTIWRPGLPASFCPTCGNHLEGDFTGKDTITGTWFDYRQPPHNGTWSGTRR